MSTREGRLKQLRSLRAGLLRELDTVEQLIESETAGIEATPLESGSRPTLSQLKQQAAAQAVAERLARFGSFRRAAVSLGVRVETLWRLRRDLGILETVTRPKPFFRDVAEPDVALNYKNCFQVWRRTLLEDRLRTHRGSLLLVRQSLNVSEPTLARFLKEAGLGSRLARSAVLTRRGWPK